MNNLCQSLAEGYGVDFKATPRNLQEEIARKAVSKLVLNLPLTAVEEEALERSKARARLFGI